VRVVVGVVVGGFGTAMLATGYWGGLVLLAIGLWPLSLAALVAFRPRAYELHLNEDGFRVLAWVCNPRKPKHGRWRWKRGAKDDDGCMPDTYRMKADELGRLMWSYRA
jgi:hypothetical protein